MIRLWSAGVSAMGTDCTHLVYGPLTECISLLKVMYKVKSKGLEEDQHADVIGGAVGVAQQHAQAISKGIVIVQ